MKHQSMAIPADLKALPQWLGYRGTKAPRVAYGNHHLASYTNPDTFSRYEDALAAVANDELDGIGIAVTEYDPFVVIDLDACRDEETGALTKFAREVVERFDTYTEVSNSGRGLHLVVRSFIDGNYKANEAERDDGKAIEFFGTAGFVILTGHTLDSYTTIASVPRAELQRVVDDLRMQRKQTKTYQRTSPPKMTDLEVTFTTYDSFGVLARYIMDGEEDPKLTSRFPRDRDGSLDRSKVIFLAALNARDNGLPEDVCHEVLLNHSADIVQEFLEEKSDGWLWRYVVEPAYNSVNGEVPEDEVIKDAEFITQGVLVHSLKPVDWLIEGVLEANALGILAGAHSTYKSTVAIDWVHSVASGRPWLGHLCRPGAAVVIAGEGIRGLARRARAWGIEHGLTLDELSDLPVLWSKSAVQVMDAGRMDKAVSTIYEVLAEQYQVAGPDLVVVDTLNKNAAGADENSAADMGLFFERLARAFPAACIVVVHHFGKDKQKGSRGSSALDAGVDFLYHAEVNAGEVVLTSRKMKDADRPGQQYLQPKVVTLPAGDEETTGITIGAEFRGGDIINKLGRMGADLQTVATTALGVLGDFDERVPRKKWVDALLADEVAADTWDTADRNVWRTQLNKLAEAMVEADLVGYDCGPVPAVYWPRED